MDISVKHLNGRMAQQIPTEFPLGLVLIVGEVSFGSARDMGGQRSEFYLKEDDNYLFCRLSERASKEITLNKGDLVRAGGHIIFDTATARYCLLARVVEVLQAYKPPGSSLEDIVTMSSRKAPEDLSPSILPQWVRELAPPEIQEEWAARRLAEAGGTLVVTGKSIPEDEEEAPPEPVAAENWQEFVADDESLDYTAAEPPLVELSDDLIEFLSEAIDSNDIIELTPGMLAEFSPDERAATETTIIEGEETEALAVEEEPDESSRDTTIEDFLSALETAIAADEARVQEQEPEPQKESEAPNTEADGGEEDSVFDEPLIEEAVPEEVEMPDEGREESFIPQPRPSIRNVAVKEPTPWYIYALVVLAIVLFVAIIVTLIIGSGVITLAIPLVLPA